MLEAPTDPQRSRSRLYNGLVTLVTFGSILAILAVWLRSAEGTLFWTYSVSITVFLILMYTATRGYTPVEDTGFRPRITVVVPAKNEEDVIESVVRTVFQSDYPSSKMEVIVVDDGSTDKTWERIQRVQNDSRFSERLVLLRHEKNYGKRVALASAVARARGEMIVCIDSDSFVERDAIKLLVQPLEDSSVTAVCGHGEAANRDEGFLPKLQHYWYAEMFRLVKGMESRLGVVGCCSGMLAAYRRSAILPLVNQWLSEKDGASARLVESGRSDASWLGRGLTGRLIKSPGEDRILTAFALSGENARVVYQSNAIVHTIVPRTLRQFVKQQLRWNRAWMHGSLLAGRFMWKKSLAASTIFYLHQFLTFLTPVIVIYWLILDPLQSAWMGTIGFLSGTLYMGLVHGLNTWSYRKTSLASVPYLMMFVPVSLFLTLTVLLYAWATPWKMGWVTRTGKAVKTPSVPEAVLLESVPASN